MNNYENLATSIKLLSLGSVLIAIALIMCSCRVSSLENKVKNMNHMIIQLQDNSMMEIKK